MAAQTGVAESSGRKITVADELVREGLELAEEAYVRDRENRLLAKVDLEMIAGYQWDDDEVKSREELERPSFTVNRLLHPVKQVANDIRRATPSVKASPISSGASEAIANIYAGLLRHIQRRSRANWVYASAAFHAAACGIGHFRILSKYVDDDVFDQELEVSLIRDPLAVLWDGDASQSDRSDANYCFVLEQMSKKAYKNRFKHEAPSDFAVAGRSPGSQLMWNRADTVIIAEQWRFKEEEKEIGLLATGQVIDLTNVTELHPGAQLVMTRKVKSRCLYHVLMNGNEPISDETRWPGRYIPVIPVIGNEIPLETKTYRHGVVRFSIDPQRLYNYWRSSSQEWIDQGPKAPYLATQAQVGPFQNMWDTHNKVPRPYLLYAPDPDLPPGTMPKREAPPQPPTAFWNEGQFTAQEIKDTSGVQDAGLGQRSNEVTGAAINARKIESDMANFEIADNLEFSLIHAGRVMVDLVPHYYDTERTIRILDEQEREQYVPINVVAYVDGVGPVLKNDLSAGRYEVDIKIGPSMTTRRAEAASSMREYVTNNPELFMICGDLIAEAEEWPGHEKFAARMRRFMEMKTPGITGEDSAKDPPPPPNPMQQAAAELELEDMATKIDYTKAKAASQRAKAARDVVGAHADHSENIREEVRSVLEQQSAVRGEQPDRPGGGQGSQPSQR